MVKLDLWQATWSYVLHDIPLQITLHTTQHTTHI